MSVDLSPSELGFKRPFNREVAETLHLSNPHDFPVAFKVKTTAPKQYCVRPNSGMIKPSTTTDVKVLLQAMKEDPPMDAKCRDKFLVQSAPLQVWSEIDKAPPASALQEQKIRVNFLSADHDNVQSNNATGSNYHDDEPPPYGSPAERFGSPAAQSLPQDANAMGAGARSVGGEKSQSAADNAATSTSGIQSDREQSGTNTEGQSSSIASKIADPELRQRKLQEASDKVQTVVQQSGDTGVPVHVVFGLCLLSFLIAYFFF